MHGVTLADYRAEGRAPVGGGRLRTGRRDVVRGDRPVRLQQAGYAGLDRCSSPSAILPTAHWQPRAYEHHRATLSVLIP